MCAPWGRWYGNMGWYQLPPSPCIWRLHAGKYKCTVHITTWRGGGGMNYQLGWLLMTTCYTSPSMYYDWLRADGACCCALNHTAVLCRCAVDHIVVLCCYDDDQIVLCWSCAIDHTLQCWDDVLMITQCCAVLLYCWSHGAGLCCLAVDYTVLCGVVVLLITQCYVVLLCWPKSVCLHWLVALLITQCFLCCCAVDHTVPCYVAALLRIQCCAVLLCCWWQSAVLCCCAFDHTVLFCASALLCWW
jgi:hypothetical protein